MLYTSRKSSHMIGTIPHSLHLVGGAKPWHGESDNKTSRRPNARVYKSTVQDSEPRDK